MTGIIKLFRSYNYSLLKRYSGDEEFEEECPTPVVKTIIYFPAAKSLKKEKEGIFGIVSRYSILPRSVIDYLSLKPFWMYNKKKTAAVSSLTSKEVYNTPVYKVDMDIEGYFFPNVIVIEHVRPENDFVVLGRNILNACKIQLNGPKLKFKFRPVFYDKKYTDFVSKYY